MKVLVKQNTLLILNKNFFNFLLNGGDLWLDLRSFVLRSML